jgi:MFS family permease
MDVPTRQSYLMAIVEPEARVVVAGVTDVVRLVAWALGPMLAGWLMTVSLVSPLLAGAAIKIVYDLLLYRAFRHVRPPEERTAPAPGR